MFGRTTLPETTPYFPHDRPDTQVLLDVREADDRGAGHVASAVI